MSLTAKKILISGGFLILLIIVLSLPFLFTRKINPKQSPPLPVPTAYPTGDNSVEGEDSPQYHHSLAVIQQQDKPFLEKDGAVGSLYPVLPYTGTNFSMKFDYGANLFVVTINKQNATQGNAEFDQFLQSHGIQSRTWIKRLTVLEQ